MNIKNFIKENGMLLKYFILPVTSAKLKVLYQLDGMVLDLVYVPIKFGKIKSDYLHKQILDAIGNETSIGFKGMDIKFKRSKSLRDFKV
jgi:hypothetical protein